MNKEDTRGFHTTFRDLVQCTSQFEHLVTNPKVEEAQLPVCEAPMEQVSRWDGS